MAARRDGVAVTPRMERATQGGTFDLESMRVAHEAHLKPNFPVPSKGSLQSTAEPPLSTPAMFWTLRPGCQTGSCCSESQQGNQRHDVGARPNIPEAASIGKSSKGNRGDVRLFDEALGQGAELQLAPVVPPPPPPAVGDGDISTRRSRTRRPASLPDMVDLDSLMATLQQGQRSAETLPLPTRLAAFLLADASLLQQASQQQPQQKQQQQQSMQKPTRSDELPAQKHLQASTPTLGEGDSSSTLVPGIVPSSPPALADTTPSFNPRPRLPPHGWKAREARTSLSDDELEAAAAPSAAVATKAREGDVSTTTPGRGRQRRRSSANLLAVEPSTNRPKTPQQAAELSNRAGTRRCRSSDTLTPAQQRKACELCLEPFSSAERESFCGTHACCSTCASQHISAQVAAGKIPTCWMPECGKQVCDPNMILRLCPEAEKERYLSLTLWSNPRVWACPQCHNLLFAEEGVPQRGWSSCPSCSHVFCLDCRCPRHEGEDCGEALKRYLDRLSKRKAPKKTSSHSHSSQFRSHHSTAQQQRPSVTERDRDQALLLEPEPAVPQSGGRSHRHKKSSHSSSKRGEKERGSRAAVPPGGAQPASAWRAGKVGVCSQAEVASPTLMVALTPTGDEKPLFEHTLHPTPRAGHKKSFSFGALEKEMHQNGFKCCPRCRIAVEKSDDGCEHIVCSQCAHEFCWLCLADRKVIAAHGCHFHRSGCRLYAPWFGEDDYLPDRCDRCLIQGRACQVFKSKSQEPAVVGQYYSSLLDACTRFFQHGLFFSTCSVTNVA